MYRRRELECEDELGEVYYYGAVVFYCVVIIVFKGVVGNSVRDRMNVRKVRKGAVIFSLLSFISLLLFFKGAVGNFVKERKGGR